MLGYLIVGVKYRVAVVETNWDYSSSHNMYNNLFHGVFNS